MYLYASYFGKIAVGNQIIIQKFSFWNHFKSECTI